MSRVIEIDSDEAFPPQLTGAGNKLVVIDCHATWCGPCLQLAPAFAALSGKYPMAVFLKVDVDKCPNVRRTFQVNAMPTIIFLKDQKLMTKFSGADPQRIEDTIVRCLAEPAQQNAAAESKVPGQQEIAEFINKKSIECLNQKDDRTVANIMDASERFLESDCDEQLLITIGFNQAVKIHSLCFRSSVTAEAAPDASAPKTIKIFVNRKTLDFDQAENTECVQQIVLKDEDVKNGKPIPLRFVKFQNVSSLTIFVQDNQEDSETTAFSQLELFGGPRESTDMGDFKRVAGQKGEGE